MKRSLFFLYIPGFILLLCIAAISHISPQFPAENSYTNTPVILFVSLALIAFSAYFISLEFIRRLPSNAQNSIHLAFILGVAILSRLVLFPSEMILETDPYRYIWDGQQMVQKKNPYSLSPKDAFENKKNSGLKITAEEQDFYSKINYSETKTLYPPVAEYLFAVSQKISPWKLTGWKAMIFLSEMLTLFLLLLILHTANMRKEWIMLYAWCPLVLTEFSNGLHMDVFMILCLVSFIYHCQKENIIGALLSLCIGSLIKIIPVLLFPFALIWAWQKNKKETLIGLGCCALATVLLWLPFMNNNLLFSEGLSKFAQSWEVNGSLFVVFKVLLQSVSSMNDPQVNLYARIISLGVLGMISLYLLLKLNKNANTSSLMKSCLIFLCSLFFLAPTGNPWYFSWAVPFLIFLPIRSLVFFSGLLFAYYLSFYYFFQTRFDLFLWIWISEYALFFSALGLELWIKKKQSQSFSPSLANRL